MFKDVLDMYARTKQQKEAVSKYFFDCKSCLLSDEIIGKKIFKYLIRENDLAKTEELLNITNFNINQPYETDVAFRDLMYMAVKYGKIDAVKFLLQHGYDGSNLIDGTKSVVATTQGFINKDQIECVNILKAAGFSSYSLTEQQKPHELINKEYETSCKTLLAKKEYITKDTTPEQVLQLENHFLCEIVDLEKVAMKFVKWAYGKPELAEAVQNVLKEGINKAFQAYDEYNSFVMKKFMDEEICKDMGKQRER